MIRAYKIINNPKYHKIVCTISGGADSDIMLDICWKCDKDNKIDYVWFDTGLEYQATKDHLKYLESRYNIEIKTFKAIKPIPLTCKQNGQPFISKFVSDYISRLQKHNFQWEDKSFEELYQKYPHCKSALQWWCNYNRSDNFNIRKNKWLKEFILKNPPTFLVSDRCCKYAKKDLIHNLIKEYKYDLNITGIRKSEGGIRKTSYKNCFDEHVGGCDNYRPLFWYNNSDKEEYDNKNNIIHSNCYLQYGMKRTGCTGCPFGRNFENELDIIQTYEPKLFVAVNNIFKDSYGYTRQYREFCRIKKEELKTKE